MPRVVLVMLDGLRPDALSEQHTPTLMRLMREGTATLTAQSVVPSITLPCHTSIFHSVPPSRHGILDNNWRSMARPVQGLVERLRQHERSSAFFYNWEPLRDLSRPENLKLSLFIEGAYQFDGDDWVLDMALPHLQRGVADFNFVYFGTIDSAGHAFGWMSDTYLMQAQRVDGLVGQLVEALGGTDTTFIIHADHGGHERTHGDNIPEDMTIPFILWGAGVPQGTTLERTVSLLDVAPTIARLLNVPPVPDWEGQAVL